MRVRMMVVAAGAVLAAACSESSAQTGLAGPGPLFEIFDGRDAAGNQHFFWLPPIVLGPSPSSGSNLPGLAAEVKILECTGDPLEGDPCSSFGSAVTFTTLTGPGSETVRDGGDHYIVNWHTDLGEGDGVVPGGTYRICVSADGLDLGHADVLVGSNGKDVKDARANGYVPLVAGSTLPIKFRIEDGYDELGVVSDAGCPGGGPTLATLSGKVSLDDNPPQSPVIVTLFEFSPSTGLGRQVGDPVTTDDDGSYQFENLPVGVLYAVCADEIGSLEGAFAPCPSGSVGYILFLPPPGWTQNFGFIPFPPT